MRDVRQRLYKTKVTLLAVVFTVVGIAMVLGGAWLELQPGWTWLRGWPVRDIGLALFTTGLVVVAFTYVDGKDKEERDAERIGKAVVDKAPAIVQAVLDGLTASPDNMRLLAADKQDQLIRNALSARLGDAGFAIEVYDDIRDQAVRAAERWHDLRVEIGLSPLPMGRGSTRGASSTTPPELFSVTVRCEYTVVPRHVTRHFVCVSDKQDYRDLTAEPGNTSAWYLSPRPGVDASTRDAFELLCRGRQDGICDLPHLAAWQVEQFIEQHYNTIALSADFVAELRSLTIHAMADEQSTIREIQANVRRMLARIDSQEEQLLDLLSDQELPTSRVRVRLRKLQAERETAEAQLIDCRQDLEQGADLLGRYLNLLGDPAELYSRSEDSVRRLLNNAFFTRIFLDDHGVQDDERTAPLQDLERVQQERTEDGEATLREHGQRKRPGLATGPQSESQDEPIDLVDGSSKTLVVELLLHYCNADLERSLEVVAGLAQRSTGREPSDRRPQRKVRRLSGAETAALVDAYRNLASVKQLATRFGVNRKTVSAVLDREGVVRRQAGLSAADITEAIALYRTGWSVAQVGEKFGVDGTTIWRRLKEADVQLRNPWER